MSNLDSDWLSHYNDLLQVLYRSDSSNINQSSSSVTSSNLWVAQQCREREQGTLSKEKESRLQLLVDRGLLSWGDKSSGKKESDSNGNSGN